MIKLVIFDAPLLTGDDLEASVAAAEVNYILRKLNLQKMHAKRWINTKNIEKCFWTFVGPCRF